MSDSYIETSDVKKYLFEFLKTEHIKNIDVIAKDINAFKVSNYNINNKQKIANDTEKAFKYINYIPIQLINEETKEILIVLQQSVSKNTYKIRKSQTIQDFNENLDEYLNKYHGPERDDLEKFKQFDSDSHSGNYNIPNNTKLYDYLMKIDDRDEYLMMVFNKDINELELFEDILIKKLISQVILNKNYRTKLITQMEYYYYYKKYQDCKKLAGVAVILYQWYIKYELILQNKLTELSLSDEEGATNKSISPGLIKEVEIIQKLINKCDK